VDTQSFEVLWQGSDGNMFFCTRNDEVISNGEMAKKLVQRTQVSMHYVKVLDGVGRIYFHFLYSIAS
jgi:hypothetical protein